MHILFFVNDYEFLRKKRVRSITPHSLLLYNSVLQFWCVGRLVAFCLGRIVDDYRRRIGWNDDGLRDGIVIYSACCQCHGGKDGANQYLSFIHNLRLFNNDFAIYDIQTLCRLRYTLTIKVVVLLNVER